MTRGRRGGVLSDSIEIWIVLPERVAYEDGDCDWFGPFEFLDLPEACTYVGSWTVEEARSRVGDAYPWEDTQCVRVGRDWNESCA